MEDVKTPITATPTQGETTPTAPTQEPEPTSTKVQINPPSGTGVPAEKTIPYSRFKQVNEQMRKYRQDLAKAREEGRRASQPEGLDEIRSHPYVQELEMKQSESQLRRGAEEIMGNYPSLPKQVSKAILRNPRGYVKPDTQDVETGLLDIEEYIQEVMADLESVTPNGAGLKQVPVAGTNQPAANSSATPAEIQALLKKPVTDWTEAEAKLMEDYGAPKLK